MQFVIGAKMETLCANNASDIFVVLLLLLLLLLLFICLLYYSSNLFEMKINNE
jgi:hypothetical protein